MICGLNFKQGGFAIGRFPFRANPFTSKDSEHAGLKEVDAYGSAWSRVRGMSREGVADSAAEAPCGRGVSRITSWEEVEVLPGANRPS